MTFCMDEESIKQLLKNVALYILLYLKKNYIRVPKYPKLAIHA